MTKLQKLPEKRPRTWKKRNKSGKMVENRKKRRENGDPGKIIRRFTENHRNNPVRGYTEAVFWYVSDVILKMVRGGIRREVLFHRRINPPVESSYE